MDPDKDWDLNALPENEIIGSIAPQSDWDSFAWTGDAANQQRFNAPTPFLEEGGDAGAVVRELEILQVIEDQDPWTTIDGNSYGGYAGADGPGTAGSADGDDNAWPTKNVIDIDVTPLVQWKLGQNASYSSFQPEDRELTILVRTDESITGGNGFVRFITKESPFQDGDLDLAPARWRSAATLSSPRRDQRCSPATPTRTWILTSWTSCRCRLPPSTSRDRPRLGAMATGTVRPAASRVVLPKGTACSTSWTSWPP